jgi:predicted transposase/invertase (TIGR01784 family)
VNKDFINDIDFSAIEKLNRKFVTEKFSNRECDIIHKIKYRGEDIYFYILIEFQSSTDETMILRMLTYILLFYQDLMVNQKLKKLPPVFPIMVYNGDAQWNSAEKLDDLIDSSIIKSAGLMEYIPKFAYYKIEINKFSAESLKTIDNLVAALFLVEKSEIRDVAQVVGEFYKILEKETELRLKKMIRRLMRVYFRYRNLDVKLGEPEEVIPMLTASIQRFKEECKLEGKIEGKLEGKLEGKIEGKLEGKLEGKVEGKLELARDFYRDGYPLEKIIEKTGFTAEEIKGDQN